MHLVIIIPCLNEEKTIGTVIRSLPEVCEGITTCTTLVIDDGSNDSTAEEATSAGAIVVRHPYNKGVGAAFHTGVEEALKRHADIIVNMDGDGQFDPADIPRLIVPVITGNADFVTASRFADPSLTPRMPWIKKWGNREIARLVSFLTGTRFHDVSCGFRAYSKDAALHLNLFGRFTYTQETFLDLAFKELTIIEVPLAVQGVREFGQSRVAHNIVSYALKTSQIILRTYRDCKPFQFFSLIALALLFIGMCCGTFFIGHYILSGSFSPHKWAGFTSAFFIFAGIAFFITGLVADILARIRRTNERILYYQRKALYYPHD